MSPIETRNTNGETEGNSSPRANGGSPRTRIGGSGGSGGKLLVDAVRDSSPLGARPQRLTDDNNRGSVNNNAV